MNSSSQIERSEVQLRPEVDGLTLSRSVKFGSQQSAAVCVTPLDGTEQEWQVAASSGPQVSSSVKSSFNG